MKKTIILGAMLLSTVAFARGYNNQNDMNGNLENNTKGAKKFENLSEEQIAKLQSLRTESFKSSQEDRLEVEGLNIDIEKLLAEEDVNWSAVNSKVQEVERLEAKLELKMLKSHEEVKAILGDNSPMLAFGRGQGRGAGKETGEMRGNKKETNKENRAGRGNRENNKFEEKQRNRGNSKEEFGRYSGLTDEQITQIKEIKNAGNTDKAKLGLEIASIDNDIQKLLIADDIDWNAIETKINEKIGHKVVMRINNYETREAIEDITGKEMIALGNKGKTGNRNMQNRDMRINNK